MRGAFMTSVKTFLGYPYPLGATWMGNGVNFALFSEHATGVELCLFDDLEATEENIRIPVSEHTDQVWHEFLPDVRPSQLYGFRVAGPYDPERGLRFNSSKLLLDPYAKAIAGEVSWADEMFGYVIGDKKEDLTQDFRDDAWGVPKSVVIDAGFDWQGDKRPGIPLHRTVIYEAHVKGFSKLWSDVPEKLRGTYAALGTPAAIDYFKKLGVTAVELLPVHAHIDDKVLVDRGLTNYWGYNTIGFFAPHAEYSSSGQTGEQVSEFKTMVRSLHAAGIEVILDVVYNHTAEGNHLGPTLCFRGIDNLAYYRLRPDNPRFYLDFTGTGNTFNLLHPRALQLVMDSLRYWVLEMHVDGFRFDLASTLARDHEGVNKLHAFFEIINQSWNCGIEGPTDDLQINALRERQRRNFLTTLFLSQGVPMLCGGDEWGRTQNGNNNAYCQDNEISWFNWERDEKQNQLLGFTQKLIQLRRDHPVFRRPKFFQGRRIRGSEIRDVMWFNPGGNEMSEEEWAHPFVRCLGMLLSGDTMDVFNFKGEPIRDDTFLLLINAHYEPIPFVLPCQEHIEWQLILDTMNAEGF